MKVIADSSFIIGLTFIEKLNLIPQLFGQIIIPQAVLEEVVVKGKDRIGIVEIKHADFIKVQRIINVQSLELLTTILGKGESECLILAQEIEADLILKEAGELDQK